MQTDLKITGDCHDDANGTHISGCPGYERLRDAEYERVRDLLAYMVKCADQRVWPTMRIDEARKAAGLDAPVPDPDAWHIPQIRSAAVGLQLGKQIHYVPLGDHGFEVTRLHGCLETHITRVGGYAANGDLGPERVSANAVDWTHDKCCTGTTIINDAPHLLEPGGWHWPVECKQTPLAGLSNWNPPF